jgi:hypothetical protein
MGSISVYIVDIEVDYIDKYGYEVNTLEAFD